jgi:hypothetical protein
VDGIKFDTEKPKWSLVPWKEVQAVVDVLTYGAQKYAPDNWKIVPNAKERYFNAAQRHISAWWMGEVFDQETKMPHLAHAICCLLFAMWHDNQPRKEPDMSKQIDSYLKGGVGLGMQKKTEETLTNNQQE